VSFPAIATQHRAGVAEIQAVVDTNPPNPFPPTSLLPASRCLGDYELIERVGQGGMAEVWMARRAVIPGGLKACALKIIHGRYTAQPRYRRMFMQEARLALKLRHANVVSVFDVGETGGRLYMALEWIDGVHLRDFAQYVRARLGGLGVPVVCHVVGELLQGLRHAHGLRVGGEPLGVIHRDVAPHNVLVSSAGEIKLADFGIARVLGESSSGEHVKGRARYMAPEQLLGDPTQASDLFAVGGILHELLDGRRFREGFERTGDWHRVVAEAPLPPLHRTNVPPALEALRVGLLQPDPAHRIASADEALAYLLRCPPWPAGATALRELYARCVGPTRRTGVTYSEPSQAYGSSAPILVAAPASRPPFTATLEPRDRPPSWTPTPSPSRGTEPGPAVGCGAVMLRRHSAPRPCQPSVRPALRWLGRGLWSLAGLLAMIAVGLVLSPGRARPSACIHEAPFPAAQRALLRLRGDGQPHAQVRIDMQTVSVASRGECWLSPGVHELAWRPSAAEPWQPVGSRTLVSAKEHLVRVGEDGLAITAYDP
jgi:serine/threonine protein kinase